MIKQKLTIKISCIILIFIFIIGISLLYYIYNSKDTFSDSYQLKNIDTNLVKNNDINNLLQECYYNSQSKVTFNSTTINRGTSTYQMYWILNLMKNTGSDISKINKLKDISKTLKLTNPLYSELDNLRMITGIQILLKSDEIEKQNILKITLNHYDSDKHLFFWKSKDENIADKISATYVALQIINNIDMLKTTKEIEDVKFTLLSLYNDNTYFTLNDPNKSIINNGGEIIKSLLLIGLNSKNNTFSNDLNKKRLDWLQYWNQNVSNNIKYDFFYILLLNNMIEINKFYKLNFLVPTAYLTEFFKQQFSFYGLGYDKIESNTEAFNNEPQIINMILKLCNNNKYIFPYKNELELYINMSIESNFSNDANIKPSIIDNYYGLLLAARVDFKYDREKMKKLVESFYTTTIDEDSAINDSKKLLQVYYLVLSYNELNLNIKDKDLIINSIENYLSSLNFDTKENILSSISDFKIGLKTINALNGSANETIKKKAQTLIETADKTDDIYKNIIVTDLCDIMIVVDGKKVTIQKYSKKILDSLDKLKSNGGYKLNVNIKDPDILSTFDAIRIKSYLSSLDDNDKKLLKTYLYSLKDNKTLFKPSMSGYGTDLKLIVKALSLSSYYN